MKPTSCPSGTNLKNTATIESQNTNLIARANSSSVEEWRAVFKSLSESNISSDPRRRANAPVNTYSAQFCCKVSE